MAYDRYSKFRVNNKIEVVPFIKIRNRSTDLYAIYTKGQSRLDTISYEYYGDSDYGWLILQANPELPSCEFEIPNNTKLRIPYPLTDVINGYEKDIAKYNNYYKVNDATGNN